MTDELQPAPEEQRLPATRPPEQLVAERFTAAPPVKSTDGLTPERSASIVRQSSSARWVGFLAVVVVALFVILYWFYELGFPLGLSQPRLEQEIEHQQVVDVERGYNIYQANCAQCHGANGEGGKGPTLNRQDKLFAHLNEAYIHNVLTVGGRYVCGDPASRMPIWSNEGNPPGPLNYRQIEELIAFLTATNDKTYTVRDEHLLDPKIDPQTGKVMTFTGWRDPNYKPDPGATPYPDCWQNEFTGGAGASPSAAASAPPGAPAIEISASSSANFDQSTVTVPAGEAFVIQFTNNENGVPHNVEIKDGGTSVFRGDVVSGPTETVYSVPALDAGEYAFNCTVHPNMTGTLVAE